MVDSSEADDQLRAELAVRELAELVNSGGWRRLPGPPELVVLLHPYPDGSVDTLSVRGESDALVERTNYEGNPVKHETGTLLDMIAVLREMPAPGEPGAPTLVVAKRREPLDPRKPLWQQR